MMKSNTLPVWIVYPSHKNSGASEVLLLTLPAGSCVLDAVTALCREVTPTWSKTPHSYAIDGAVVDENTALKQYDRVEILFPVTRDPKETRRSRALHAAKNSIA